MALRLENHPAGPLLGDKRWRCDQCGWEVTFAYPILIPRKDDIDLGFTFCLACLGEEILRSGPFDNVGTMNPVNENA